MASLGSFLPPDYKITLANRYFKEGSVFKCYYPKADKEKIFILCGFKYDKKEFASLFFNTEINSNVFPTQKLRELHLPFTPTTERPYLTHDCFLDCSKLIIWSSQLFYDRLCQDPSLHVGILSDEDFKLAKAKIKTSFTISPSEKKNFGLFL